jgi:hypothetical protein
MLRQAGSMLVSGLLGGPIGLIINIATTIAEKATGIDPEKIITAQLNPPAPVAAKPADDGPMAPPADVSAHLPTGATAAQLPLSQSQLEAYGVSTNTSGNLMLGTIEGADVLNAIQLAGLSRTAAAAYGANQLPPPRAAARGG